ncbi:MAG: efflux RND transporter permease subunit [Leptospiraceae bacterium]|nr:efflux RND transporter permease subunit [Leptospiraceae bacterium]MCP5497995.1 efflux RND transporter permease subunit [Leptospiraceae bacterium]
MYKIIEYLIDRPKLTNLILVFIFLMAAFSISKIKRLGFPRVDFEQMRITTPYPGASPEDVELNVTVKLEEALKGVTGIEKYTSRSMENVSVIDVAIDSSAEDKKEVKADIRRAIEGVNDLPAELQEDPGIFEIKVDNFEVYIVVLTMPGASEAELRKHAKELKRRILEIDSVSKVYTIGMRKPEIKIYLNRKKMAEKVVSFEEVIQAIKYNKMKASGGSVESYTTKTNIVTFSEFETPEEIGNLIIRSNFPGNRVYLKEVAEVVYGFEEEDRIVRFNGQRGMGFSITKKGPADIIQAVEKIEEVIEKFKKESAPQNLKVFSTYDTSIETKKRLDIVYGNAILGFIFVLLILFLFLDSKIAFWTAFGIPVSIAITLILLPLFDITMNSISLCGLVVVIGMVVDDAIIISESISRAKESGMSSRDAAIYGLKVVIKPVIGTIATTMLAFVPMYYIPGMVGSFSREIPSIVILMLTASFLEATFFLPTHLAHEKKSLNKPKREPLGIKVLALMEEFYVRVLKLALGKKYLAFFLCLVFLASGLGFGISIVKFNLFPIDQSSLIFIYGETIKDSTLEFNEQETKKIEDIIQKLPKGVVHSYVNYVGLDINNNQGFIPSTNSFIVILTLTPVSVREMKAIQVKEFIQNELKKHPIEGIEKVNFTIDGGGPPVGKPIEVKITGNDRKTRIEVIEKITKDLKKFGVTEIDSDYKEGKKELRLLPNHEIIAASGLNVAQIASVIRTAYDGTIVTYLQTTEEKIPFRVILDEESKDFEHPLKGLKVRNLTGNLVNLESLVKITEGFSPQNIFHYNSYRTNSIYGNIDLDKTTPLEVFNKLNEKYKDFARDYPGFSLVLGGEAKESSKMMVQMTMAISLAVIAIYFLLVVQFNSFSQPMMVILAIPFGLMGIFIAFGIQGMDLSMLALIGILGFTGVIINDSLVMVDFINTLREDKNTLKTFDETVVEGAKMRLRPIVLTTLTTVVGLIPTAYGIIGGIDYFISPMVMAMTWGLLVGTSTLVIFIPLVYSIQVELTQKFSQFVRIKIFRKKEIVA